MYIIMSSFPSLSLFLLDRHVIIIIDHFHNRGQEVNVNVLARHVYNYIIMVMNNDS